MAKQKLNITMMPTEQAKINAEATWNSSAAGRAQRVIDDAWRNKKAGEKMPDDTIYLGLYGGKDWFVQAEDAKGDDGQRLALTFNAATEYATNLRENNCADWTLPPSQEDANEPPILNEMFKNRRNGAFQGTYVEQGNYSSGWYWSSSRRPCVARTAWSQRFSDGLCTWCSTQDALFVRCVRSKAPRVPATGESASSGNQQ